jgi:hypothetical protein
MWFKKVFSCKNPHLTFAAKISPGLIMNKTLYGALTRWGYTRLG